MGKKKLTDAQKKELILKRKQKEKEQKEIMIKLQEQKIKDEKIMDQLVSLKDMNSVKLKKQEREEKKRKNSIKQVEEEEEQNVKKVKIEDQALMEIENDNKVQPAQINIFQQSIFENPENIMATVNSRLQQQQQQSQKEKTLEIEIAAKKLFPDYNFDLFEARRNQTVEEFQMEDTLVQKSEKDEDEIREIKDQELVEYEKSQGVTSRILSRDEEIQKQREKLPIYFKEGELIEHINQNLVTLVCGATGSGKSTQIPQFLYEHGYSHEDSKTKSGMIAITQPRRLAAISLAKRVAQEMNLELGKEVVYQVRHDTSGYDSKISKIKFMTDGILLNEMSSDFLLSRYSVIIIDEAHERKVNTDLLLGLLSRVVNIRKKLALQDSTHKNQPLRLVIMSATLRIEDFTKNKYLIPQQINVINVEARQYPVNIYYNKRTSDDYLDEAVKKCVKVHTKLPPGDILVFLTGEREIKEFCVTLKHILESKRRQQSVSRDLEQSDFELKDDEKEGENLGEDQNNDDETENQNVIAHDPIQSEGKQVQKVQDFVVLPLYSKLSAEEQELIFQSQKRANTRVIIAATNVAETSLTIPNIKYVIDTGKQKQKIYSQNISLTRHVIGWVSQASADQRTGRSGRTSPGYCYRLYAPSVYANIFEKFSEPEILNMPLESVILHLKSAGIKDVLAFPFPSRPKQSNILRAIQNLLRIGALDASEEREEYWTPLQEMEFREDENLMDKTVLNELGKVLAMLPINPKYGKMLLQGRRAGLTGYVLLLVGILSVEEIFNKEKFRIKDSVEDEGYDDYEEDEDDPEARKKSQLRNLEVLQEKKKQQIENRKKENASFKANYDGYFMGKSDLFVSLNLLGEFFAMLSRSDQFRIDALISNFAREKSLLTKSVKEIYQNLEQLLEIVSTLTNNTHEIQEIHEFFANYKKPDPKTQNVLSEIIISTFIDKIARKVLLTTPEGRRQIAYESSETTFEYLHIPSSSFLYSSKPNYVCYTSIMATSKPKQTNEKEISCKI